MKTFARSLATIVAAGLLSACGGGQTTAIPTTGPGAGASSQNKTPLATASLTLKGSLGFHTAKGAKKTNGSGRRPAYVNSNANYLDVWVVSNNIPVHAVDSTGGPNVSVTPDGSQTYQIPIYSVGVNEIVAYETDAPFESSGNLLAIGETDVSVSAGQTLQLSLTMLMNAQFIGIMSNPDDGNSDSTTFAPPGSPFTFSCCSATHAYFFVTDPDGGFVDVAGTGGVSAPIVTDVNPPGLFVQSSGVNGGYSFASCSGGTVTVKLTAANPAYAIATDATHFGFQFPGADVLYSNASDTSFPTYMNTIVNAVGAPTISNTFGVFYGGGC